jgi:hypothetical protein
MGIFIVNRYWYSSIGNPNTSILCHSKPVLVLVHIASILSLLYTCVCWVNRTSRAGAYIRGVLAHPRIYTFDHGWEREELRASLPRVTKKQGLSAPGATTYRGGAML